MRVARRNNQRRRRLRRRGLVLAAVAVVVAAVGVAIIIRTPQRSGCNHAPGSGSPAASAHHHAAPHRGPRRPREARSPCRDRREPCRLRPHHHVPRDRAATGECSVPGSLHHAARLRRSDRPTRALGVPRRHPRPGTSGVARHSGAPVEADRGDLRQRLSVAVCGGVADPQPCRMGRRREPSADRPSAEARWADPSGRCERSWPPAGSSTRRATTTQISPSSTRRSSGFRSAQTRTRLRRLYGAPVAWFCYPSGRYNASVVAAVRAAGFVGATTVAVGWARPGDDPFALPRLRVLAGTTPAELLTLIADARNAPPPPT